MTIAQIVHDNEMFFGLSEEQIREKACLFILQSVFLADPKAFSSYESGMSWMNVSVLVSRLQRPYFLAVWD